MHEGAEDLCVRGVLDMQAVPFNGTTVVTAYNGVNLIYQGTLSTHFDSTGDVFGWQSLGLVGGVDNLNVVAVPEPGTMALDGLSGLSLLFFRRHK